MAKKQKIIIVEDHRMLREGLKAMLDLRGDLEIIGEAADGLEAVQLLKRLEPDLMLLDLSMPRMNGTSVAIEAKACHPNIKILALSMHKSEDRVREAFDAGVDGYCSKNDDRREFMLAIDTVLSGRTFISSSIADNVLAIFLANRAPKSVDAIWESISRREKEILKLLAEGYTNNQIAHMLFISTKTVEKHRANLMSKLAVHNLANLTTLAIKKGLVEKDAPQLRRKPTWNTSPSN